jgi:DegV family protein with EDD domain
MKVKILTDTSCGLSREEAKSLGYEMVALPFLLDEVEYDEDKLTKKEFYEKLKESNDIHTSQAPIPLVTDAFDRLLKENDYVIYLPITSGLSSSYESILPVIDSNDVYKERVVVMDHKTISVLQRGMLADVKRLIDKGVDLKKIKELVEANAKNNRIYIAVDTLDYLKKGGRVSALSATVGSILNIKPVLFSNGNKFEVVKKARGLKAAEESILNFVLNDMNSMFPGEPIDNFVMGVAYTECIDEAENFRKEVSDAFETKVVLDELSTVIGCHIGAGAVAAAIYKKVDEN